MRSPEPAAHASAADLAACAALLRGGSRTFFAASLILPRRLRQDATALYAFCRLADDAVDGGGGLQALAELQHRLDRAYAGSPLDFAADRALADVVARHGIPRALPAALIEGFAWDAECRRYEQIADLRAYAARVAGAVGAMMAMLMGARAPQVIARACDLGVAMQLTNIARDVGEDARYGRLYLPLAWLRDAGIDADAFLARPRFSLPLGGVVYRLLDEAQALYARAATGVAGLPLACRPGMHAARLLYAEIGREVLRQGLDSVSRRAVVPAARKARLLALALSATAAAGEVDPAPALAETQFLVEAVAAAPRAAPRAEPQPLPPLAARSFDERVGWLVDLFERLERRERVGQPVTGAVAATQQ
jgi:phytoene synthase